MQNRVNQKNGPHRRPVGVSGAAVSSEATERWARPTVARHACGVERCVVGFTHGCSLARSASSLSALSNLSSTLQGLKMGGTMHLEPSTLKGYRDIWKFRVKQTP